MVYKIRNAEMSDLSGIAELESACFPPAEAAPIEAFQGRMERFLDNFFVAEADGRIIGAVNGSTTNDRTIVDEMFADPALHVPEGIYQAVFGLAVHPDYQKMGIAQALMEQVIADAKRRGKRGVILTCKERLIHYYEKFGYRNLGVSQSVHGGAVWYDMILEFADMKYDYLVVGAGLYGSVFAHEAKKKGKTCLVIDKRSHIAGNIYCKEIEGINVHQYGAHIFHTSNKRVWDYIQQFAEFNHYINSPIAVYKDELYNLPFNMNTFSKMWGIRTPQEAKEKIAQQVAQTGITEPANLEEQGLSLVGRDVFEKLVKGYTEKQWGRSCKDLPAFIIKRLPVRFTYDNNYFNDRYQGIPIGGYTKIVEKMLDGIEVRTDTDYFTFIKEQPDIAGKTVFTGMIDEYFSYRLGALEYRSVRFETEVLDTDNYQGNAVVNYTEREIPYTRIIEHKHFEFGTQEKTVISREYSSEWQVGEEPYYPVNDAQNNALFKKYQALAEKERNVIFGGRLGSYQYYDMDKVIEAALDLCEREF